VQKRLQSADGLILGALQSDREILSDLNGDKHSVTGRDRTVFAALCHPLYRRVAEEATR
jgi:hypothetical protein